VIKAKILVRAGGLQISLAKPQSRFSLVVGSGALAASHGLSSRARGGRTPSLLFKLTATDATGLRTALQVRVKSRR
jgi:hypothetical protein